MSPADTIALLVVVGLPVLSWFLAGSRRDSSSVAFLVGAALFSVAVALYLVPFSISADLKTISIRALVYCAVLMFLAFMRVRLGQWRRVTVGGVLVVLLATVFVAYAETAAGIVGAIFHHSLLIVLQFMVLIDTQKLWRRERSRGLIAIAAAMFFVLAANIGQLVAIGMAGRPFAPVLDTPQGVWVYAANILCVMLYSTGFWSHGLDVARAAEIESAVVAATAEAEAVALSRAVKERNEMLMVNSRFEALNNLGVFNAAVIHDLSQPLQRMLLNTEYLREQTSSREDRYHETLESIYADVRAASDVVGAVRGLLVNSPTAQSWVEAGRILDPIYPIIQSQCAADGVELSCARDNFGSEEGVEVSPTILGRLMLNLVSNALQALRATEHRHLHIAVTRDQIATAKFLKFTVTDNGVGLPDDFDLNLGAQNVSSSSDGMGLGLVIARQIIAMWAGSTEVRRCSPGTEISFCLPLRSRRST